MPDKPKSYRFPEGVHNAVPGKFKYNNEPTEVDGLRFASKKEARRYGELLILERAKKITELKLQPRFPIIIDGIKVCTYVADFSYQDTEQLHGGGVVVEDVKGVRTAMYKLKKKLFEASYRGFHVVEI